jgi:hypothetical protein
MAVAVVEGAAIRVELGAIATKYKIGFQTARP